MTFGRVGSDALIKSFCLRLIHICIIIITLTSSKGLKCLLFCVFHINVEFNAIRCTKGLSKLIDMQIKSNPFN